MQLIYTAAASALVLSSYAAATASLVVNTPSSLFECSPVLLSWTGGVAPYTLRINEAGSTSTTLETLVSSTDDLSYTWTVNLASGQKVTVAVTDSTGASAYSAETPDIGTGTSTCLSSTSSSGSTSTSASGSTSTVADASTTTSAASATSSASSSSGGTTTTSSSASAASSTTTSSSDAAVNVRGFAAVAAGVVGVAVAALV